MKNKLFIFGSSGFLGKSLSSNLTFGFETIKVGRISDGIFFDLESSNPEDLKSYITRGDIWIFLAAITSPDECESNPNFTYKINVHKSNNLIAWLTNLGVKVLFASSDAVFGNKLDLAYDEDIPKPLGEYAKQKAMVENFVRMNKLVKVIRFSYIFGPEDKFFSLVRESEKSNKKLAIYLGFKRCVVLLDDVINGIQNLIENWDTFDFQAINFCGPELVDRNKMASVLKKKFFPKLIYYCKEPSDAFWISRAKIINVDSSAFSKVLGRSPKSIINI